MNKLLVLLVALLLVACGAQPGPPPEPTAGPPPTPRPTSTPAPVNTQTTDDSESSESETEEPVVEVEAEPEEEDDPTIDRETGLLLNPEQIFTGVEFVVRGTIVSMNLTPQDSPEFLIQAPTGQRYRMRTQPLSETFADDGRQLRAHEYRQGMQAQATVILPLGSTSRDILVSENLLLLLSESE